MWQTNDAGDPDRVIDDGEYLLNDALTPDAGTTARGKFPDSLAIDDAQILLSDLLASGIEAVFGWLTDL